jgi:hypothetical protein
MPRSALALLAVLAVAVLVGAGLAAAAEAQRWRRPLPGGAVVGSFSYERSAPYVRGRRRGIDLAGAAGAPVLAACGGVVRHAGRVPGFGRGVTVRCGPLVATELGLAAIGVRTGQRLAPGAPIGRLGAGGVLRLGARLARDGHGYVDPLTLLAAPTAGPTPVAPAPGRGGRHRARPHGSSWRAATAAAAPAPRPARWSVLAGLGLLTAGLAGSGAAGVRRRRRTRTGMALAQR